MKKVKESGRKRYRNIVLTGFKCSGKSRIGKLLAKKLELDFMDIDSVIEQRHKKGGNAPASVRTIYKKFGAGYFEKLEAEALKEAAGAKGAVLSLGGGTPMNSRFDKKDFVNSPFVYLLVKPELLYGRIKSKGFPPFIDKRRPRKSFETLLKKRTPVYRKIADICVENSDIRPSQAVGEIMRQLEDQYGR